MKIIFWLTLSLLAFMGSASCQDGDGQRMAILSDMLSRAKALQSFHFVATAESTLDPKDSAFLARTEVTSSFEVWGKKTPGSVQLCEATAVIQRPPGPVEGRVILSNLWVFDGARNYCVRKQNGIVQALSLDDPKHSCKMFLDPETCITELLSDSTARYLGRKVIEGRECVVFETVGQFFAAVLASTRGNVEVALLEASGLPARLKLKKRYSSGTWRTERIETNPMISDRQFEKPAGFKYIEGKADGLGGFQLESSE